MSTEIFDPAPYSNAPRMSLESGIALARALVAACPKTMPARIHKAAQKLAQHTDNAQAKLALRQTALGSISEEDKRLVDQAGDGTWGAHRGRHLAYSMLPAAEYPDAKLPGKLSVSHAQLDLFVDLLGSKASIDLLRVPYKGGAPATTDAIAGQGNMVYALAPVLMPHVQAGKLKALAVSNGKRLDALPNVPTFAELGVDYDISIWYGLLAPAGTPTAIVQKLQSDISVALSAPDARKQLEGMGFAAITNKPDEFAEVIRSDMARWQGVMKRISARNR